VGGGIGMGSGSGTTTQPIPIEGRLQLKLGYDQNTLQLIVTLVCATGLSLRQSGAGRNPYAKVSETIKIKFCILFLYVN